MTDHRLQLDGMPTETLLSVFKGLRGRDFYAIKNTCHRFREIFDKYKLKMLPPLANSVEICGLARYPNPEYAVSDDATIKISYPGKKRASLFYKIRAAFEDERLQPLPRSAGAEKFDCLEMDGVKFYKPEPLLTHISVIAHGSVLDTIANILNNKIDQAFLRKFSITELKFNDKFCNDLMEWISVTGVRFGTVEYTRCKINCEARYFTPLISAQKEIILNECKCTHGSPSLFEGNELKMRLSKVEKLYLKPFVDSRRFHDGNGEIAMAIWREQDELRPREQFDDDFDPFGGDDSSDEEEGPIDEDPQLIQRPERQHAPLPIVFENNDEERAPFPRFPFGMGAMDPGVIPHFPVVGFEANMEAWPGVDPGWVDENQDWPEEDREEPMVDQEAVEPHHFPAIHHLFHNRRNERDDEPDVDPDRENHVDPFMNLGGPELLSTIAKDVFWGSHSALTEQDAVQFVKELLEGSRVIQKFTLEHRRLATYRALVAYCNENMEKTERNHFKFKSPNGQQYYVHFTKFIFKIQTIRFK